MIKHRLTAFLLAALFLLTAILPVAAETESGAFDLFYNQGDVASSEVTYGVDEFYNITISKSIDLNPDPTKTVEAPSFVALSNVTLPRNKFVSVSIGSANYDNGWKVVYELDPTLKIGYTIKKDDTALVIGDEVLSCDGGTASASTALTFQLSEKSGKAGSYADLLTFTTSVNNIIEQK